MKRTISIILAGSMLASCATHRSLIDTAGVDRNKMEADMKECQAYADQVMGVGSGAAAGAIGGLLLGFLMAKAGGAGRFDAPASARMTGVAGAAVGAGAGAQSERDVVNRCMSGRGYKVLSAVRQSSTQS